jgi:putative transposase
MREQRKHLRRLDEIHLSARSPVFLLTCCVRGRSRLLANVGAAGILVESWRTAPELFAWAVGRYVIMPDHVHFFASPCAGMAKTLSVFVGSWKSWTRKEMRTAVHSSFEWQREFFDHILRSEESYEQKWDYVRMNPVRAGLAGAADEWPYRGEIEMLEW